MLRWNTWLFPYKTGHSNLFIIYTFQCQLSKRQPKCLNISCQITPSCLKQLHRNSFMSWNGQHCVYSLMVNSLDSSFSFLKWTHISNKLHVSSTPTLLFKRNSQLSTEETTLSPSITNLKVKTTNPAQNSNGFES